MKAASEPLYPRPLSQQELTLLSWCVDKLPQDDSTALKVQLARCQVIDEDNGGLWFRVSPKSRPLQCQGVDLVYGDVDGGSVQFIIAFVAGYLGWVDRYRADGAIILDPIPAPARVRSWKVMTS